MITFDFETYMKKATKEVDVQNLIEKLKQDELNAWYEYSEETYSIKKCTVVQDITFCTSSAFLSPKILNKNSKAYLLLICRLFNLTKLTISSCSLRGSVLK